MTSAQTILHHSDKALASRWQAELELGFVHNSRGTRLAVNRHLGPLCVQRPFYPEGKDVAHVYILHPPGGIVSGDDLAITVNLAEDAKALLTTPGAGRVYRARDDGALQQQRFHFRVAKGACLEWLPLENIVFSGANTNLETRIELESGARAIAWDVTSLGLPANQLPFEKGCFQQTLRIFCDQRPHFIERLNVDAASRDLLHSAAGMRDKPINGLFIAGPFSAMDDSLLHALRQRVDEFVGPDSLAGISWVNDFLVGRYLGDCSQQGRELFGAWWQQLRPALMGREASPPRIWLT